MASHFTIIPIPLYRRARSRGNGKLAAEAADFAADALLHGVVVRTFQGVENPAADPPHLVGAHAAGREGRRADANAAGVERLARVERNHIHVHGDAALFEHFGRYFAADVE